MCVMCLVVDLCEDVNNVVQSWYPISIEFPYSLADRTTFGFVCIYVQRDGGEVVDNLLNID